MPQAAEPAGFDRLQDPKHLAKMFRRTGGVRIKLQGMETWGHTDVSEEIAADLGEFERRPDGGAERSVAVLPTGAPPDEFRSGTPIEVDGRQLRILHHTPIRDGRITALVVGEWLHEVSVYRPQESGTKSHGQQQTTWKLIAEEVPCEIRSRGGGIRETEASRRARTDWQLAMPPPGFQLQPDDGLLVTAGAAMAHRLKVTNVGNLTDRWTLPVLAEETDEGFGISAFTEEFTGEFS